MLGHMNREALKMTLETGRTWFYSRTHHEIWNMGANSGGNYQNVVSIFADNDNDSLLIRVNQIGNACRTGTHSCFYKKVFEK
jgi:phosphoribosyl-AMP cyclohydrolase